MITDELVVTTAGSATSDWYSVHPSDGQLQAKTLGLCSSIGLGLAIGRPDRRVIVLDGDGRVDVAGTEYAGMERIGQQLNLAFSQRERGEILEPPHVDGDHVTWVATSYDRVSAEQYRVRSNIWTDQGKITRFTSSFAL